MSSIRFENIAPPRDFNVTKIGASGDDAPFALPPEYRPPSAAAAAASADGDNTPFTLPPEYQQPAAPELTPEQDWARKQENMYAGLIKHEDADVDYQGGVPWAAQLALDRADNPAEAAAALERRVGKGNYGQDRFNQWWVLQNGKKMAVSPHVDYPGLVGSFWNKLNTMPGTLQATDFFPADPKGLADVQNQQNFIKNTSAGLVAGAPQTAGAMGGALLGTPAGPLGMVAGAGLGGAAGYGASEVEKGVEGTLRKTPGEEALAVAKEGALNAAFQGAGHTLQAAGRGAKRALLDWLGSTPAIRTMTQRLVGEGAVPPIMSVVPDARGLRFHQIERNKLVGNPMEAPNVEYFTGRARDILASEGFTPEQIETTMREATDTTSRLGGTAVGRAVTGAVRRQIAILKAEAKLAQDWADRANERALKRIQKWVGGGPGRTGEAGSKVGRLGADVERAIVDARIQYGDEMQAAYDAIDAMAGDQKVIPAAGYRLLARIIRKQTPAGLLTGELDDIADMDPRLMLSFGEAHAIRNQVRRLARGGYRTLTPDVRAHMMFETADEANTMLESFADTADYWDFTGVAERLGTPKEVVQALRDLDAKYGKGIAKFNNALLNSLVRDAKDDIFPDPNVVARAVMKSGQIEQTRVLMSLLPQELRDRVARADAYNLILGDADMVTGKIGGKDLLATISDPSRAVLMKEMYPPRMLKTLTTFAQELAARGGYLDVQSVRGFSSGRMRDMLVQAVVKAQELDDFVKQDIVRALASTDPEVADHAADRLLTGGNEAKLAAVRDVLGPHSVEWETLQRYALRKVFRQMFIETPERAMRIQGEAIDQTLGGFTDVEQELLFPSGLKEDLKMLAKHVRFVFPPAMGNEMAAGLAAGSILSHLPGVRAVKHWLIVNLSSALLDKPALIRFLADAERRNPGSGRRVLSRWIWWWMNDEAGGPGSGRPTQAQINDPRAQFGIDPGEVPPFAGAVRGTDGKWHIPDYYGPGQHGTVEQGADL